MFSVRSLVNRVFRYGTHQVPSRLSAGKDELGRFRGDEDLYAILGVRRAAKDEEIRQAYLSRAKVLHPDLNQSDEYSAEAFKLLSDAYKVLSDSKLRRKYDWLLKRQNRSMAGRFLPHAVAGLCVILLFCVIGIYRGGVGGDLDGQELADTGHDKSHVQILNVSPSDEAARHSAEFKKKIVGRLSDEDLSSGAVQDIGGQAAATSQEDELDIVAVSEEGMAAEHTEQVAQEDMARPSSLSLDATSKVQPPAVSSKQVADALTTSKVTTVRQREEKDAEPTQVASLDRRNGIGTQPPHMSQTPQRLAGEQLAKKIQSELKRLNCYSGTIDGEWGPSSKLAAKNWQIKVSRTDISADAPDKSLLDALLGADISCTAMHQRVAETQENSERTSSLPVPAKHVKVRRRAAERNSVASPVGVGGIGF